MATESSIRSIMVALQQALELISGTYLDQPHSTTEPKFISLPEKYRLQVITDHEFDSEQYTYRAPNAVELKQCFAVLDSELAVYNPEIIHATQLDRIVICSGLNRKGEPLGGVVERGMFVIDTMFLNASGLGKNPEFSRRVVHHELFHAIDYVDTIEGYIDTTWRRLQSENYDYSYGNKTPQPSDSVGFVTDYATSSIMEDKAELYSFLITQYAEMERRAEHDSALERKIHRMKELLHGFSALYDESFWDRLRERSEKETAKAKRRRRTL